MRQQLVPQEKVLYNLSMRLDAFLSKFAGLSRSQSRKVIKNRTVIVNGEIVNNPSTVVTERDVILVDGRTVEAFGMIYIALNKPPDYVCSRDKTEGRSVFDLVDTNFSAELSVAGRLDKTQPVSYCSPTTVSSSTKLYRLAILWKKSIW